MINWIFCISIVSILICVWFYLPKHIQKFTGYTNQYTGKKIKIELPKWMNLGEELSELRASCNRILGRSTKISYDKEKYLKINPDSFIIWDCNIVTKKGSVIWNGDLNVTENFDKIYDLSKEIGDIYLLPISDIKDVKNKWVLYANKKTVKINDTFRK